MARAGCWLRFSWVSVWLLLFFRFDVVASEMPGSEFFDGMFYELDGRATMHAITANMAERFEAGPLHTYWSSYHRLEEFSRPKYERVAGILGVQLPNRSWILIKAKAISCLPQFMMSKVMSGLRQRTIVYVERLRRLSEIGPAEGHDFYAYMVRQELLQVQIMDLALREEYSAAEELVAQFITQESAMSDRPF
ncbi:hypothetical protein A9179_12850 [Pseudomonas alcaligenes]|uniref:Uncharacterized protein n=1 Tax=Aquipseudomonas alcaligenes TaxID=43263 RepID=A0ABR7S0N7_AQUAC|nr:hypothetical protein [Pseudomonas alcaligenes]MBC9251166.1 hypothetical protein [Pseudomonas alcaligenes]